MASDSVMLVAQLGGELVTYTPFGGVAKTFKAIVNRVPPKPEQAGGYQYQINEVEVVFPRDATDGVVTVQEGKDVIRFKPHLSDTQARDYTVMKIVQQDAGLTASDGGMFTVAVEGA